MRMESSGRTQSADGRPITSRVGAMGLMQLMPETWKEMRRLYGLGADPYDPHDNVLAGTAYLRSLYQKFGFPRMFAAYNAGPATVDAQSAGTRDLPHETLDYLRGVAHILGATDDSKTATPRASREKPTTVVSTATPMGVMTDLTRPDGAQVEIDPLTVTGIRAVLPNEYTPGVQTVVSMASRTQGVLESPAEVMARLRRHGARI